MIHRRMRRVIAAACGMMLLLSPIGGGSAYAHSDSTLASHSGMYLTPDSVWRVNLHLLEPDTLLNARHVLNNVYIPTHLIVNRFEVHCVSAAYDTCVFDSDYGMSGWYGTYDCIGTVAGSNPHRTCSYGRVRLNLHAGYGTHNGYLIGQTKHNICHELGHAVGLQHNSRMDTSCLAGFGFGARSTVLDSTDINAVDLHY